MSIIQEHKFFTQEEEIIHIVLNACGYNISCDEIIPVKIDNKISHLRPDFVIKQNNQPDIVIEVTTAFRRGYGRGHGNRTKHKITKRRRISALIRNGINIIVMDIKTLIAIFKKLNLPFTEKINQQIERYPDLLEVNDTAIPAPINEKIKSLQLTQI